MKRLIGIFAVALVGALLFSGCSSKGGNAEVGKLDSSNYEQLLEKGVSTKSDVRKKLGAPTSTRIDNKGHEIWSYEFHSVTGFMVYSSTSKVLEVEFDNNNVVADVFFEEK